ncbi:MAG: CrcB family protein [Actinomycetota bacterium]|nr:CrcB family protein [Actinomycetota bacterium]
MGTGFCGAFTTFSTWMVETVHLTQEAGRGGIRAGLINLLGQLVAGSLSGLALLAVM